MTDEQKSINEQEIVKEYKKQLKGWGRYASLSLAFKVLFIFTASLCAVIAAVAADDKNLVRMLGVGGATATLASAMIDLIGSPKAWLDAWRSLGTSISKYEVGKMDIENLIERHHLAETRITIMATDQPPAIAARRAAQPTS